MNVKMNAMRALGVSATAMLVLSMGLMLGCGIPTTDAIRMLPRVVKAAFQSPVRNAALTHVSRGFALGAHQVQHQLTHGDPLSLQTRHKATAAAAQTLSRVDSSRGACVDMSAAHLDRDTDNEGGQTGFLYSDNILGRERERPLLKSSKQNQNSRNANDVTMRLPDLLKLRERTRKTRNQRLELQQ